MKFGGKSDFKINSVFYLTKIPDIENKDDDLKKWFNFKPPVTVRLFNKHVRFFTRYVLYYKIVCKLASLKS